MNKFKICYFNKKAALGKHTIPIVMQKYNNTFERNLINSTYILSKVFSINYSFRNFHELKQTPKTFILC